MSRLAIPLRLDDKDLARGVFVTGARCPVRGRAGGRPGRRGSARRAPARQAAAGASSTGRDWGLGPGAPPQRSSWIGLGPARRRAGARGVPRLLALLARGGDESRSTPASRPASGFLGSWRRTRSTAASATGSASCAGSRRSAAGSCRPWTGPGSSAPQGATPGGLRPLGRGPRQAQAPLAADSVQPARSGLHPVQGRLRGTYPPRRYTDLGEFALLARRYGPGGSFWDRHPRLPRLPVRAWQVWNEPNLPVFGRRDPTRRLRAPA